MQKLIYHHYNQFSPPFSPLFQRKHIAFYHHRKATKKVKSDFRPFEKLSHSWKERKPLESSEKTFTLRSVFLFFPWANGEKPSACLGLLSASQGRSGDGFWADHRSFFAGGLWSYRADLALCLQIQGKQQIYKLL